MLGLVSELVRRAPYALTPRELAEALEGPGRAQQVYAALRRGEDPFLALEVGLRRRLAQVSRPSPIALETLRRSTDGTSKLRLRLEDGARIETVLIPERTRTTVCISTQVGCGRGCMFCLTSTMGMMRNLEAEEIVHQVVEARRRAPALGLPEVRNVVLMGMGEPLDNHRAVARALGLLTDNEALGVGARHVTVSTVGPSPAAIARTSGWPGQLAWSLHAARPEVRRRLIPTARHSPEALRDAFQARLSGRRRPTLFVEIALIDGVNDQEVDAAAAAALFEGSDLEVRFNLLPMNPGNTRGLFTSPRAEAMKEFLQSRGYFCSIRRARGGDELAACGQLVVQG